MTATFDVSGLKTLVSDLEVSSREVVKQSRDIIEQAAVDVRDKWRSNARATAGEHGKRYPDSIKYKMVGFFGVGADIYPDPDMPQGNMSFELGSVNQPPHLDGQRAIDELGPKILRQFDSLRFLE